MDEFSMICWCPFQQTETTQYPVDGTETNDVWFCTECEKTYSIPITDPACECLHLRSEHNEGDTYCLTCGDPHSFVRERN